MQTRKSGCSWSASSWCSGSYADAARLMSSAQHLHVRGDTHLWIVAVVLAGRLHPVLLLLLHLLLILLRCLSLAPAVARASRQRRLASA